MVSKVLKISLSAGSFIYTFFVVCRLSKFFSQPRQLEKITESTLENIIPEPILFMFFNISLISAFVIQHSLMASDFIKDFYFRHKISDIERSIFNLSTAATLHFLIVQWKTIPVTLWNFDVEENYIIWTISTILQNIGWCIVYCGCCMLDIAELVGVKQVYYSVTGRPPPMTLKSIEYQRYLSHMRHPSFTGFFIILWAYPIMSIDRVLLASVLTAYMILMWCIDQKDYYYHSYCVARKERTLNLCAL